ncbi:apolipoprotein D-like [Copidosoma floridanum]|uniref:apolipoprotein D-like n=1 Tax=Copidosoma floridanum TaxID=29053 RepID=UPI0006C9AE8D|nr:apolipoprotein D-like [Copidosoma floridanum]
MKSCYVALLIAALAIGARAQIPYFGSCPEYLPMPGFDMERFLGVWHEAERNFQLSEIASRCVMSNYTRANDGKLHVINEVRSQFTGIKRVLEGEIKKAPSKAEEGKLHVKYTSVPVLPYESQYSVLETDYDNYAVLWSCTRFWPLTVHNAWIMTRQRIPPGEVLQRAYGILDKYKISKVLFLKTNQEDCSFDEPAKATEPPKNDDDEVTAVKSAEAQVATAAAAAPEPTKAEKEGPKSVTEIIMKIASEAKEQPKEEPVKEPLAAESVAAKEEEKPAVPEGSAPVVAEEKKPEIEEQKASIAEIVEEKIEIVKP